MITKIKKKEFHPLEIAICGHSNAGKSTLIQALIKHFSKRLNIGYIKHDAHHFEMDHKGKDTSEAQASGATQVAISSTIKSALLFNNGADHIFYRQNFVDSDVVFIEGYKDSLTHKIMMWTGSDEDQELLNKYLAADQQHLLAIIGTTKKLPNDSIPYFHRDDLASIIKFIQNIWQERINSRPLFGLILGGGKSTRMGQDKALLSYHGKSQSSYLYDLLEKSTDQCFVSCRTEQANLEDFRNKNLIKDSYIGFGPTGGILSAMKEHPHAAWLVIACDMPYLNQETIKDLINRRNPYKLATCFYNQKRQWPEPLCTIYEPKAALKLGQYLTMGNPCPRKVLMNSSIESILPLDEKSLENINTMEEFQIAQTIINELGV